MKSDQHKTSAPFGLLSNVSWGALVSITVATTTGFVAYKLISRYGLEGSYYYVWEGSQYPPRIRAQAEALDAVQETISEKENSITNLEQGLQRAQRAVPSTADSSEILLHWQADLAIPDIRTYLAQLSDSLDKIAARVDGVNSAGDNEIKVRKKALSKMIVQLMDQADALIAFYNKNQA